MKNKLIAVILTICFTVCFFTGCKDENIISEEYTQTQKWLEYAMLDIEETPEELYKKAKNEGVLTIYSVSTRMMNVARSFEKEYEGLFVNVVDLRANEIADKLNEDDYQSYNIDLIFISDVDGVLSENLNPNKKVFGYIPYDIKDKLLENFKDEETTLVSQEAILVTYNDRLHSEPPIKNWWELTEPKWKGHVYAPNPIKSVTTLSLFVLMQKYNDQMESAYFDRYGKDFESDSGESAAQAFIRMLVENDLNIVNSSDEVVEAVGRPGKTTSNIGIMTSTKLRLRDIGYNVQCIYDIKPFCGLSNPISIVLVNGSKNVNTAKLFVRWILGEKDGQGEGYKPYLDLGAWSVRSDVKSRMEIDLESLNLIPYDGRYVYKTQKFVEDIIWKNVPEK